MTQMSPHVEFCYISRGESDTRHLGEIVGRAAEPGDVVGLQGELGAGKTQFVKGLAVGAGAQSHDLVTSPTFVLLNSYSGRIPVRHYDLYRLESPDLEALGYFDLLPGSVTVLEWSDKAGDLLGDRLEIRIETTGPTTRELRATAAGPRGRALAARIRKLGGSGKSKDDRFRDPPEG